MGPCQRSVALGLMPRARCLYYSPFCVAPVFGAEGYLGGILASWNRSGMLLPAQVLVLVKQ